MGCRSSKSAAIAPGSGKKRRSSSVVKVSSLEILPDDKLNLELFCLKLCELATCELDHERSELIKQLKDWTVSDLQEWSGSASIKSPGVCHALTGFATSKSDVKLDKIPFVAFRGYLSAIQVAQDFKKKPVLSIFQTTAGHKVGKVHDPFLKKYEELRGVGLVEFFSKSVKGKPLFLMTGHGCGGAIASLFATDLIVDNSVLHTHGDTSSKKQQQEQQEAKDEDEPVFYEIPEFRLITFGAPRVFDKTTASKLQRLHCYHQVIRLVSDKDLLPALPLSDAYTLQHFGESICYKARLPAGWCRFDGRADFDGIYDNTDQLTTERNSLETYLTEFERRGMISTNIDQALAGAQESGKD